MHIIFTLHRDVGGLDTSFVVNNYLYLFWILIVFNRMLSCGPHHPSLYLWVLLVPISNILCFY